MEHFVHELLHPVVPEQERFLAFWPPTCFYAVNAIIEAVNPGPATRTRLPEKDPEFLPFLVAYLDRWRLAPVKPIRVLALSVRS